MWTLDQLHPVPKLVVKFFGQTGKGLLAGKRCHVQRSHTFRLRISKRKIAYCPTRKLTMTSFEEEQTNSVRNQGRENGLFRKCMDTIKHKKMTYSKVYTVSHLILNLISCTVHVQ